MKQTGWVRYDVPWRLNPDNFTPPTRTPWGGRKLPERYKAQLALSAQKRAYRCVGESWEVSTGPLFPSICEDGTTLCAAIAAAPARALGSGDALPFVVKWLDAADDLSVQVHPRDDYAGLGDRECGKRECWFIIDAEPNAALYIGFRPGVTRAALAASLAAGETLVPLLNRVPVKRGDVVDIAPGLVHALGKGICLIEPQSVKAGKISTTYRVWDWDRRYNPSGERDLHGTLRPLHLAQALAVIDFSARPVVQPQARVDTPSFSAGYLGAGGSASAFARSCLAVTVVAGCVEAHTPTTQTRFFAGESFFCPAESLAQTTLVGNGSEAIWTGA